MQPYETFEHDGVTVEIHWDDDGEHADPRRWDNLTTMVCWHPDYALGDFQVTNLDGRGAVSERFERDDFRDMRTLARYLTLVQGAVGLRPLYLYDHSGISISAGSPNPFDNPTVRRDEFGQGLGWDSSMVGFVYTTHERITELCGDDPKYHAEEWVNEQVSLEVRVYNDYLTGQVYGYIVAPGSDDEESCWGYLGDPDAKGGCRDDAKAVAAGIAKERREARAHPWLPTFGNPIQRKEATT